MLTSFPRLLGEAPLPGYEPIALQGYEPVPLPGYEPIPLPGYEPIPLPGYEPASVPSPIQYGPPQELGPPSPIKVTTVPFYKKPWYWVAVATGVAAIGTGAYLIVRRRR